MGEKHIHFTEFLYICGRLHKRMKTQKSDQERRISHLSDKRCPTFLAPGTNFTGNNFSMDWEWGRWFGFKHITFIVHFISIIITSSPPEIICHYTPEIQHSCSIGMKVEEARVAFKKLVRKLLQYSWWEMIVAQTIMSYHHLIISVLYPEMIRSVISWSYFECRANRIS